MKNIQMVLGVPCLILEEEVEQGIYWQNEWTQKLAQDYRLVVRPDTGDMFIAWKNEPLNEGEEFSTSLSNFRDSLMAFIVGQG